MSDQTGSRTTAGKALRVNLDLNIYGAFAEIGAGQEVARHFFQAGRASQTIAKTISAYDMIYSDEIYGKEKNGRYVCESRLNRMLEKEYSLLLRRLNEHRGGKTTFFSYANTVATGSAETPKCHGWMGIRFQKKPGGEFNDIVLHVRMMDRHRLQQQEALGMLGVNLVYSAFYHNQNPSDFMTFLVDGLKKGQIVIDVIKFAGPDLKHFNNKKMNLELVKRGLAEAVLFAPQNGIGSDDVATISDTVWGKGLLIQRGFYRPVTQTHLDVMSKGFEQLKSEIKAQKIKASDTIQILEITSEFDIDVDEFWHRVQIITSLGYYVLISNFKYFYEMKRFFRNYTQAPLVMVMSARHLQELFDPDKYKQLEGHIFEALGKLLDEQTKLYIYPHKNDLLCLTTKSFFPDKKVNHLYRHFIENSQILDISGCDDTETYFHSSDVQKKIETKEKGWEKLVPAPVAEYLKKNKLWGYAKAK
ncbi:MAG: hypothetical protein JNL11_19130 [Bdellovibrionaceae bacterium]|nr:hypothetical protein [Pseudobdellovibrionaceae bacterium]